MSVGRNHVMASNLRLKNQIEKELFSGSYKAWQRVYGEFCKRHGNLMPNKIMQFKYKGEIYKLPDDITLRGGVSPLHDSLVAEFKDAYQMFVVEREEEYRIFQNMLAHAIRIAKYAEDLIEILPECMHPAITESGFFQMEDKPSMSIDDVAEFNATYEKYFGMFDARKLLGAVM